MNMRMSKKYFVLILVLLIGIILARSVFASANKVTICHATASNTNPYVSESIDVSSLGDGSGHGASGINTGDIVPPTTGTNYPNGQNWDTTGQAIWNNSCSTTFPTATPTPTSTPTCTPTPTKSVTPTPTQTLTETLTPIPTQAVGATTSSQGISSSSAPSCSDSKPGDIPNFTVKVVAEGMELEWALPQNATTIDVRYGLTDGLWSYGVLNIPNSGSYIVAGLQPNTPYYFQIAGVNGCTIGNWSHTIDPVWRGR